MEENAFERSIFISLKQATTSSNIKDRIKLVPQIITIKYQIIWIKVDDWMDVKVWGWSNVIWSVLDVSWDEDTSCRRHIVSMLHVLAS